MFNNISNELDKLVSKNMRRHKLSNLDLTNQAFKDSTPITLISVYNLIKEHMLVLIYYGLSYSMEKALIVDKYKVFSFRKKSVYETAAKKFINEYSMKLKFKLDEFGGILKYPNASILMKVETELDTT